MKFVMIFALLFSACQSSNANTQAEAPEKPAVTEKGVATPDSAQSFGIFAGGCFWCTEKDFEKVDGVIDAVSGFAGGPEVDPSYKAVASGQTGHTEVVKVIYDPSKVTYPELVESFWMMIDPTDARGQFVDRGPQYRPEIFYVDAEQKAAAEASKKKLSESNRFDKPIIVPITKFDVFYPAEDYHQDFYKKSAFRYNSYRKGSGRDQFISKYWSDKK